MEENISIHDAFRGRFQLSRLLHGISMDIEEILGGKTDEERDAIWGTVLELVPQGCKHYMGLMEETGEFNEADEVERFLLGPHGISVVEALSLSISRSEQFTLQQQAEFFACLAEMLLRETPYEIRWAQTMEKGLEFETTDPLALIQMSVHATNAMYAIQEAKRRQAADSIPDHKVAAKAAEMISEKASRNGALAHIEHRSMKAHVFEWCEANFSNFRSMDQAALAVAGKEVKVGFATTRSWIREWKQKKAQSSPS